MQLKIKLNPVYEIGTAVQQRLGKLCLLVSSAQKWEGVVGCCPAAFIMQTLAAVQQCSKRVGPGRLLSSSI